MFDWLRQRNESSSEPIVASPDWEGAAATPMIIDLDEFETAHDDPAWKAFCEEADEYLTSTLEHALQPTT
ncbi:MAG: hypothetical protein M3540_12265 [Actinomycetota bacterium]|nr:hypothetical protein [Actinomycetota bacterium]